MASRAPMCLHMMDGGRRYELGAGTDDIESTFAEQLDVETESWRLAKHVRREEPMRVDDAELAIDRVDVAAVACLMASKLGPDVRHDVRAVGHALVAMSWSEERLRVSHAH